MPTEHNAGPLFLVGMPRSGTKLLRDMLNRHRCLRFSAIETEFFPFWVAQWDQFGAMDNLADFQRFYRRCLRLPFFLYNAERGIEIDCREWFRACEPYTPAAVFEALMRLVLSLPEDDPTIWGDKSPSYVSHVPLLMQQFPGAKIIHIVRDVRDCSLSAKNAWGKNMLRAAQRWQDDVSRCRDDGQRFPSAYIETRYEDLLVDPRATLSRLCSFINVDLDEKMLVPGAETENKGDARGMSAVLKSNTGKYKTRMSPRLSTRIEMIACTTLRSLDYPCDYEGQTVRLPRWRLFIFQLLDGINLLFASMSERGLKSALQFHLHYFRTSGNRVR